MGQIWPHALDAPGGKEMERNNRRLKTFCLSLEFGKISFSILSSHKVFSSRMEWRFLYVLEVSFIEFDTVLLSITGIAFWEIRRLREIERTNNHFWILTEYLFGQSRILVENSSITVHQIEATFWSTLTLSLPRFISPPTEDSRLLCTCGWSGMTHFLGGRCPTTTLNFEAHARPPWWWRSSSYTPDADTRWRYSKPAHSNRVWAPTSLKSSNTSTFSSFSFSPPLAAAGLPATHPFVSTSPAATATPFFNPWIYLFVGSPFFQFIERVVCSSLISSGGGLATYPFIVSVLWSGHTGV